MKMMARKMSNKTIIDAFDLYKKYGITTLAVNIIGVPGESKEQIWNTIRLNRRLKPTVSAVNIFYPYRGTKLGDFCFDANLVDMEKFRSFSNERRDTTLAFPPEHRDMLLHYYRNWQLYVKPYDPKLWAIFILQKLGFLEKARAIKHAFNDLWVRDHSGQLKQPASTP